MTKQHLEELLASQRRLMWALPAAERECRLREIRLDYLYEEHLRAVAFAMQEPPVRSRNADFGKTVAINAFQLAGTLLILSPVIWMLVR